jgi:hypothetical protein
MSEMVETPNLQEADHICKSMPRRAHAHDEGPRSRDEEGIEVAKLFRR